MAWGLGGLDYFPKETQWGNRNVLSGSAQAGSALPSTGGLKRLPVMLGIGSVVLLCT